MCKSFLITTIKNVIKLASLEFLGYKPPLIAEQPSQTFQNNTVQYKTLDHSIQNSTASIYCTCCAAKKISKEINWLFAEIAAKPQVATCGSSMQRRPHLCVASIDIGSSVNQQANDIKRIINTALSSSAHLHKHTTVNSRCRKSSTNFFSNESWPLPAFVQAVFFYIVTAGWTEPAHVAQWSLYSGAMCSTAWRTQEPGFKPQPGCVRLPKNYLMNRKIIPRIKRVQLCPL